MGVLCPSYDYLRRAAPQKGSGPGQKFTGR